MIGIAAPEEIVLNRIRLRRPNPADTQAIFEYGSDPEVAHFADWPILESIESLIHAFPERAAMWDAGTEFSWVITRSGEDRAIGGVSCTIAGDCAEIGYLVHRSHWGNGYATEATRSILDWILSLPSVSTVSATCDVENAASLRVLEKLGFTRIETLSRAIVRPQISDEPRDAFLYSCAQPIAEQD